MAGGADKGTGRYTGNDSIFGAMFGRDKDGIIPKGGRSQPYLPKNPQPVEFEGKMYYQLNEKYKGKEEPTRLFIPVEDADPEKGVVKTMNNKKMILTDQLDKDKKKPISQAGDRESAAPSEPLAALDYDLG
jgi:hypothetical protein